MMNKTKQYINRNVRMLIRMRMLLAVSITIVIVSLNSCVNEYTPSGIDELSGLLVVEGLVSNDSTDIKLSRSIGIYQNMFYSEEGSILNAKITVECNDGTQFTDVLNLGDGNYRIYNGVLSPDKKYRLSLTIDDRSYESEYLAPLITPPIDNVSLLKSAIDETVYVTVSTHDPENKSLYYLWSYEDHWELKSDLYGNARWSAGPDSYIIMHSLSTSQNTYYCWDSSKSRTLILASSEKLSENIISNHRLAGHLSSDDRWSVLYYIKVKQSHIRREAYDYYTNMKKNVEQTSSIFSPIPTEMKGNIICITHPEEDVIGYVEVSASTVKEMFFPTSATIYEPSNNGCHATITDYSGLQDLSGYQIYEYTGASGGGVESVAYVRCLDCTLRGSKERPSFWPNNHY